MKDPVVLREAFISNLFTFIECRNLKMIRDEINILIDKYGDDAEFVVGDAEELFVSYFSAKTEKEIHKEMKLNSVQWSDEYEMINDSKKITKK